MIKKPINKKKKKKVVIKKKKLSKISIVPKKTTTIKKKSINVAFEFRKIDFKNNNVRYISGIDPSLSSTGISVYDIINKKYYADSIRINKDICLCEGDRYGRVADGVCNKLSEWGLGDFTNTICFMEQPSAAFGGGFVQINVLEFIGVIKEKLARNFLIVPIMVPSPTVKGFHQLGNLKNKDKKEYTRKLNEKFIHDGVVFNNDDEGDSFLVMKIAKVFYDGNIDGLSSNQIKVLYKDRDKIIYQTLNAEEKTAWNKDHKKDKDDKDEKGEDNGE